jgi:chemotaxis protein MotB
MKNCNCLIRISPFNFVCLKKKYTDLEARNKETQDLLNTCTVKLNSCLEESGLTATVAGLKDYNQTLISSKDMTVLTTKGAQNVEKH